MMRAVQSSSFLISLTVLLLHALSIIILSGDYYSASAQSIIEGKDEEKFRKELAARFHAVAKNTSNELKAEDRKYKKMIFFPAVTLNLNASESEDLNIQLNLSSLFSALDSWKLEMNQSLENHTNYGQEFFQRRLTLFEETSEKHLDMMKKYMEDIISA